ncbi:MAG: hypothetical protein J6B04_05470 [Clostridia bacterium]|nr:hypothetical protein [Clostridia bacterium]
MTNTKKQVLKNIGWVALGLAIVLIVCYLFSTCDFISADKEHDISEYAANVYQTRDKTTTLIFNAGADAATLTTEKNVYDFTLEFEDNIFIMKSGEVQYEFIVINETTLFSNTGQYLYKIRDNNAI